MCTTQHMCMLSTTRNFFRLIINKVKDILITFQNNSTHFNECDMNYK